MTAPAIQATAEPAYTDMTLEELIDARADVVAFRESDRVKAFLKEIADAAKAQTDLETMIALRLEESGARKFERGGYRGEFRRVKRGSASVHEPDALLKELVPFADELVPRHAIDEALTVVVTSTVKPDLRKVRKLADYGDAIGKIVRAHIAEPTEYEILVIEAIPPEIKDVTPREAVSP